MSTFQGFCYHVGVCWQTQIMSNFYRYARTTQKMRSS